VGISLNSREPKMSWHIQLNMKELYAWQERKRIPQLSINGPKREKMYIFSLLGALPSIQG